MNQRLTASQAEKTKKITMIGLMTAVTCILGPLSLPLPFSPVPITLTNFAVFLSIYILGMKYGTISLLIYLALGTIGLPVFSSFSGGLGKLAGHHTDEDRGHSVGTIQIQVKKHNDK